MPATAQQDDIYHWDVQTYWTTYKRYAATYTDGRNTRYRWTVDMDHSSYVETDYCDDYWNGRNYFDAHDTTYHDLGTFSFNACIQLKAISNYGTQYNRNGSFLH